MADTVTRTTALLVPIGTLHWHRCICCCIARYAIQGTIVVNNMVRNRKSIHRTVQYSGVEAKHLFFLLGERNPIVVHDASNVVGGLHIMRLSIMACAGLPSFFLPFLTEQST
jgi:hypothetical protein